MATTMLQVQGNGALPVSGPGMPSSDDASAIPDSHLTESYRSSDSLFVGTSADFRQGYLLADRIHDLHEPWRTRFVELIALRVDASLPAGRLPSRTQIAVWLSAQKIGRLIGLMLASWTCEDW